MSGLKAVASNNGGSGGAGVSSLNSLTGALSLTAYSEIPSGTVNGSNTTFTLANTPLDNGVVQVVLDGLTQYNDSSSAFSGDFSVSGTTITFAIAPSTGTSIYAFYLGLTGSSAPPSNAYVAEDGATYYVAEDGVTYYVQES
jgi:hypothetical protein